jgi:hypothetical protein
MVLWYLIEKKKNGKISLIFCFFSTRHDAESGLVQKLGTESDEKVKAVKNV